MDIKLLLGKILALSTFIPVSHFCEVYRPFIRVRILGRYLNTRLHYILVLNTFGSSSQSQQNRTSSTSSLVKKDISKWPLSSSCFVTQRKQNVFFIKYNLRNVIHAFLCKYVLYLDWIRPMEGNILQSLDFNPSMGHLQSDHYCMFNFFRHPGLFYAQWN